MGDTEPAGGHRAANLAWKRKEALARSIAAAPRSMADVISFDRSELREIFKLYCRKVGEGEWHDYAIDVTPQKAVFFDLPAHL